MVNFENYVNALNIAFANEQLLKQVSLKIISLKELQRGKQWERKKERGFQQSATGQAEARSFIQIYLGGIQTGRETPRTQNDAYVRMLVAALPIISQWQSNSS